MGRSSGIILPIYALPSPHGVGTLGRAALDFVDFLADAGQAWWQMLPVGPTGYGDSPYQSASTFAGNPYFIDLDALVADGLLDRLEVDAVDWGRDAAQVDYRRLYEGRPALLRRAFGRARGRDQAKLEAFRERNASWLPDYALFMAVKGHFGMAAWTEWPDEAIRLREPAAMERYRALLEYEVGYHEYVQFLFFSQWERLHAYARGRGVGLMGDMPIYVALDSADVWANPGQFMLDGRNLPIEVAGVPPDAFTADGQLWGNPLYDYAAMAADGFDWWVRRVGGAARLFDMLRIDHFRGFESFWAVPAGSGTAKEGRWVKGPGMGLVGTLKDSFPQLRLVAEDLGYATPEVEALLAASGLPGMKVLQFAFDSRDASGPAHLPHAYTPNCVCYVGTHDNATVREWLAQAAPDDLSRAERYLGLNGREGAVWGFIRGGMSSVAELFVAQMQDYLELGAEARTNAPGTLGGNWRWRMTPGQATPELARRIAAMTELYGRNAR